MAAKKKAAKKKVAKKAKKPAKKVVKKKVAKKPAKKIAKKKVTKKPAKKVAKKPKAKRVPSAEFMKPLQPSPELARIVGDNPLPRTEVTKRLWQYIKRNNLQDPVNKRMIRADENLRPLFGGRDSVSMFEMTKIVNQHLS